MTRFPAKNYQSLSCNLELDRAKFVYCLVFSVYIRCTDVIDVIIIIRRHVGGIPNVDTHLVKMRKSESSYAKVI